MNKNKNLEKNNNFSYDGGFNLATKFNLAKVNLLYRKIYLTTI